MTKPNLISFVLLLVLLVSGVAFFNFALWLGGFNLFLLLAVMIGWFALANIVFFAVVGFVLKCPHCNEPFGRRNYLSGTIFTPMPLQYCPHCQEDTFSPP